MTRRHCTTVLLLLLSAVCLGQTGMRAQTGPLPTIDTVLDKFIAGSGGRAALQKITSINAKGTVTIEGMNLDGTIELLQKAPDKALTTVDLQGVGQQRDGFDGTVGWSEDPQNGVREKSGVELAEARRSATFGRELKMKDLYASMTVTGRENVGTRPAYVVKAETADGAPVTLYFDAESGLLVRQIATSETPQGPLQVDTTYDDFRPVDGVKRPFAIRRATSVYNVTITITDIKHNIPIDDAVFKMPK